MKRALGDGYELDDDRTRLDREAVHAYLGGVSYWAEGRSRARQEELIDASARVVGLYGIGEQAIQREWFIIAARHQALEHIAADLWQRDALHDQRIEAVERTQPSPHQTAALWRIGIGISEMIKAGRQRRLSMHGDAVPRLPGVIRSVALGYQ